MALRLPPIGRFGVELGPDGLGVEPTEVDLDADVMSGFLRRRPDRAEARVGPVLREIVRPADELRPERRLVGARAR